MIDWPSGQLIRSQKGHISAPRKLRGHVNKWKESHFVRCISRQWTVPWNCSCGIINASNHKKMISIVQEVHKQEICWVLIRMLVETHSGDTTTSDEPLAFFFSVFHRSCGFHGPIWYVRDSVGVGYTEDWCNGSLEPQTPPWRWSARGARFVCQTTEVGLRTDARSVKSGCFRHQI